MVHSVARDRYRAELGRGALLHGRDQLGNRRHTAGHKTYPRKQYGAAVRERDGARRPQSSAAMLRGQRNGRGDQGFFFNRLLNKTITF